jgi:hypothetical protein
MCPPGAVLGRWPAPRRPVALRRRHAGDAQPLNWRYGPDGLRLLDWGEVGVGSPVIDREKLARQGPEHARPRLAATWRDAWLAHRPGCDPDRAAALVPPIASLRGALVYQDFLDGIEASEHVYHRDDVPDGLRDTLAALHRPPARSTRPSPRPLR